MLEALGTGEGMPVYGYPVSERVDIEEYQLITDD